MFGVRIAVSTDCKVVAQAGGRVVNAAGSRIAVVVATALPKSGLVVAFGLSKSAPVVAAGLSIGTVCV